MLVWHDNTGLSPAWFLSQCTVRDLQTGVQYTFLVDSWLSLEVDDGVVQKTVKVAGQWQATSSSLLPSHFFCVSFILSFPAL